MRSLVLFKPNFYWFALVDLDYGVLFCCKINENLACKTRLDIFLHSTPTTFADINIIFNWTFKLCVTAIVAATVDNVWLIFIFVNDRRIKRSVIVFHFFRFYWLYCSWWLYILFFFFGQSNHLQIYVEIIIADMYFLEYKYLAMKSLFGLALFYV